MGDTITLDTEQLIALLERALSGDQAQIRKIGSALIQVCLEQGDEATAQRLRKLVRRGSLHLQASGLQMNLPVDGGSRLPLVDEVPWPTTPAILNDKSAAMVQRFLEDARNAELLNEKGLASRLGLMLSGPPGTGKTLLAGHIAAQLRRPFFVARLDALISSRLGETAKNIRQIFEFVPVRDAVLFLDELDAIAKLRDDRQELGELKRVVNTVIQGLDSLEDRAIVIGATNHPQLLDPAIWRRFPYRVEIELPEAKARTAYGCIFFMKMKALKERRAELLGLMSDGLSGAEIETIALAAVGWRYFPIWLCPKTGFCSLFNNQDRTMSIFLSLMSSRLRSVESLFLS